MTHILFVCTANLQRSPTAEKLFANCPGLETKSAGTDAYYGKQVTQELINWAQVIFVMSEEKEGHLSYIKNNFSLGGKKVHDLGISDEYKEDSAELKKVLVEKVSKYIDLKPCLDSLLTAAQKNNNASSVGGVLY